MKTKDLLAVLKFVGKVIGPNNVLPITDRFLFENGTVTATNLETTIIAKTEIKGTFLVDSRFLLKVLGKTSAKEVDIISTEDGTATTIKALDGPQEFKVSGETDIGNFPKTKECPTKAGSFTGVDMNNIYKARQIASKDELRIVLTGVYLNHELKEAVSTDAHILTYKNLEGKFKENYILPKSAVSLLKDFGNCKISTNESGEYLQFENGDGMKIITRVIDGKFPKYQAVIPKNQTTVFKCDRKELLKVIEEALICVNTSTYHMALLIKKGDEHITVRSEDLDFDRSFKGTFGGSLKMKEKELRIGFNAVFFKKCLRYISADEVELKFGAANQAVIMNNEVLQMPVMLND